jgi:hypothetical protein
MDKMNFGIKLSTPATGRPTAAAPASAPSSAAAAGASAPSLGNDVRVSSANAVNAVSGNAAAMVASAEIRLGAAYQFASA